MNDTTQQKKNLAHFEEMFNSNELTGNETPSQVRNAFPHLFSDPFPNKQMWARRYNSIQKKCGKRPSGMYDHSVFNNYYYYVVIKNLTSCADILDDEIEPVKSMGTKKRLTNETLFIKSSSEDDDPRQHVQSHYHNEKIIQTCNVNLDHAVSFWNDPKSASNFISIVIFLPSGVPNTCLDVSVLPECNGIMYMYNRPLPARSSERLCRRWTSVKNGRDPQYEPYHPFVLGFESFFKAYRTKNSDTIQSQGKIVFDGKKVERHIHEHHSKLNICQKLVLLAPDIEIIYLGLSIYHGVCNYQTQTNDDYFFAFYF